MESLDNSGGGNSTKTSIHLTLNEVLLENLIFSETDQLFTMDAQVTDSVLKNYKKLSYQCQ